MKNYFFSLLTISVVLTSCAPVRKYNLLIGTYTNSCESKGIYVYKFDTKNGNSKLVNSTEKVINPSYLTVSKNNDLVYAVNEIGRESTISAFNYESKTGELKLLNKQSAMGADPCYIINDERNVIAANYSGGSIAVFGKKSDGSLEEAKQVVQHHGKGKDLKRQEGPHVHMVHFSPDHNFILASDLGLDMIYSYQYNPNSPNEALKVKDSVGVSAGGGPRHLTFSKDGKFVYLLQELNGALTVFSYSNGRLTPIDQQTVLAKDFKGTFSAADIHISPDGKFLYATNRGEANSISIFKIQKNGKLQAKGLVSTLGRGPRNFAIDPSGKFLLVAHQYSNDVVIFSRNKRSGSLTDTKKRINLCAPVCLVFTKN